MSDPVRQELAASADAVVVKVGTRILTRGDGVLDYDRVEKLSDELCDVLDGGRSAVLVSSGAVGAGMRQLGLAQRPTDIAQLQAVAAVGQTILMEAYRRAFLRRGRHAAQVLLTASDLHDRARYLNVRNTLLALRGLGAIAIINENDTVAVDELMPTFGDNDRLAALVTNALRAPLLVILSDIAGLYDRDPQQPDAQVIPTVPQLDESIYGLVRDRLTGLSKGGMAGKLEAVRIVTTAGENVVISSGREPGNLARILAGETVGTLFLGQGKSLSPRKRWLGFTREPAGRLTLDDGARRAIVEQGKSLLAAGITAVEGEFLPGDLVALVDAAGKELARGLTNYSSADLMRIKGFRSSQIEQVLGHLPYDEVIHRDNMTVVGKTAAPPPAG